jgi:hypothetical protein
MRRQRLEVLGCRIFDSALAIASPENAPHRLGFFLANLCPSVAEPGRRKAGSDPEPRPLGAVPPPQRQLLNGLSAQAFSSSLIAVVVGVHE